MTQPEALRLADDMVGAAYAQGLRDQRQSDEALLRKALEALELGYDSAKAEADQYHAAMAGYRPQRHAQMDADVQQIATAITALKAALVEDVMQKFTDVNQELMAALGCDHCNSPLYAAVKCRVCGRETPIIEPKISLGEDVLECPNCASLEAQNTELDRKLAELDTALRAQL